MGADRTFNKASRVIKLTLEHFRETGLDCSVFLDKTAAIIFDGYPDIASLIVTGHILIFFKGVNGFNFQVVTYEQDEEVNQWRALLADHFGDDFIFRTRFHHDPEKLLEELRNGLKRFQASKREG